MSESELIEELRKGNNKAYKILYEDHYVLLCKIAFEFVGDKFTSESIVGDVIFKLWEKRETIFIETSLRAYLVKSVRNSSINYLKQEYLQKEIHLTNLNEIEDDSSLTIVSDNLPLVILLEKELEKEIEKALNLLPEESRKVFLMSRNEQLKYSQISEKLNISVNTVKYHMKSALSKLNEELNRYLLILIALIINCF